MNRGNWWERIPCDFVPTNPSLDFHKWTGKLMGKDFLWLCSNQSELRFFINEQGNWWERIPCDFVPANQSLDFHKWNNSTSRKGSSCQPFSDFQKLINSTVLGRGVGHLLILWTVLYDLAPTNLRLSREWAGQDYIFMLSSQFVWYKSIPCITGF